MKKILCVAMVLLMLGSLAACGVKKPDTDAESPQKQNSQTDASEKVTLELWWWGEEDVPGSRAWLEETAAKYEEETGIHINLTQQTSDNLMTAWEASVQAGEGADIQFFWTGIYTLMYVWGEKSSLTDLSEYISEEEMSHWMGTDGVSMGGTTWAQPWYLQSIVLLYNKELFRSAGLDPEKTPENYEEFLTTCEELKQSNVVPFEIGGMKDGFGTPWIYSTIGVAGHDDVSEYVEAALEPGAYETEAHVLWLEVLANLYEKGYINPLTMSNEFQSGRESFLRGESAMGFATYGQAIQWIEEMGGDDVAAIMKVPAFGDGKMAGGQNVQSQAFGIPAFSKHKQEAADFMVYMHQPEQLNRFYEHTKNFPADDRFNADVLSTPSEKFEWNYLLEDPCIYPSLYMPSSIHSLGNYAACQMVLSGEDAADAAAYVESMAEQWRSMNPEEVKNFTAWAETFQ